MSTDNFIASLRTSYTVGLPGIQGSLNLDALGHKIERDAANNPEYLERIRLHSQCVQYYALSTRHELSEEESDIFNAVLTESQSDYHLSKLLSLIDEIILLDEIDLLENLEALKTLQSAGLKYRENPSSPIPNKAPNTLVKEYYALIQAKNEPSELEEKALNEILSLANHDKHLSIIIDVINDVVLEENSIKENIVHEYEKYRAFQTLKNQGLDKIAQSKASALQVKACTQIINLIFLVIVNIIFLVVIYPIAILIALALTLIFPSNNVDVNLLQFKPLQPIRCWLGNLEIKDPVVARRIARFVPAQCPFERDVVFLGRTIAHIPPMCKLNPLYNEVVGLRFRALCFLADECGEDISALV